jgi:nicotinate phosphoribosyltransferase
MLKSLLDTDLYKLTMMWAVLFVYPRARVIYQFFNRDMTMKFSDDFCYRLERNILKMDNLQLSCAERDFLLQDTPFLPEAYIDYLKGYRYNTREVEVKYKNGVLTIEFSGKWHRTILWETQLMAVISETYFENQEIADDTFDRMDSKIQMIKDSGIKVAELGTRRRHSYAIQDEFIKRAKDVIVGTSNVHFAMKYGIKPVGTVAHEWFMYHGAKYGYRSANFKALEAWSNVYRGDLGIALSDTYGTDDFLFAFDKFFAKLFDGVRHDSGDPFDFGDKIIKHYESKRIDPMSKTIIFSDGLNIKKAVSLASYFEGRINVSFGIGTHLTNDTGLKPLNMVIKITHVYDRQGNKIPTVKLSDNPVKNMSVSPEELEACKYMIGQHKG